MGWGISVQMEVAVVECRKLLWLPWNEGISSGASMAGYWIGLCVPGPRFHRRILVEGY